MKNLCVAKKGQMDKCDHIIGNCTLEGIFVAGVLPLLSSEVHKED